MADGIDQFSFELLLRQLLGLLDEIRRDLAIWSGLKETKLIRVYALRVCSY